MLRFVAPPPPGRSQTEREEVLLSHDHLTQTPYSILDSYLRSWNSALGGGVPGQREAGVWWHPRLQLLCHHHGLLRHLSYPERVRESLLLLDKLRMPLRFYCNYVYFLLII